jgi:hypothetical protein
MIRPCSTPRFIWWTRLAPAIRGQDMTTVSDYFTEKLGRAPREAALARFALNSPRGKTCQRIIDLAVKQKDSVATWPRPCSTSSGRTRP